MKHAVFAALPAILACLPAAATAQAQERGRLALFGAETGPEFTAEKKAVDDAVYDAVRATGRFEILRDADLFRILQFDPQIAAKNCGADVMCISQLGDTIKVFWIARTVVLMQGGKAKIEVSVFHVAGAKLLDAVSVSVPWPGSNLREEAVKLAIAVLKKVGTGNLKIDSPLGGEIVVDGSPSGMIPTVVEGVAAGVHKLRVTFKGAEIWTGEVKVDVGETALVTTVPAPTIAAAPAAEAARPAEAPMRPSKPLPPPLNDPYFWTAGGATVAFLSVGVAMAALKGSDEDAARSEPLQVKARDLLASAETKANTANIFLGLGLAALVGTGVVVYLDLARSPSPPPTSLRIGPVAAPGMAGAALSGAF